MKASSTTSRNFNSIKVQLKPASQIAQMTYQKFQFHKGTIKTNTAIISKSGFCYISIP